MQLINVDGAGVGNKGFPGCHPFAVSPDIAVHVIQQAGRIGAQLAGKSEGISLERPLAVRALDGVFIGPELFFRTGIMKAGRVNLRCKVKVRQTYFPGAVMLFGHGIALIIPKTKFTCQADSLRVGRPHGEMPAIHILPDGMRTKHPVCIAIRSLMKSLSVRLVGGLIAQGHSSLLPGRTRSKRFYLCEVYHRPSSDATNKAVAQD